MNLTIEEDMEIRDEMLEDMKRSKDLKIMLDDLVGKLK
jgi:hypothetical protein